MRLTISASLLTLLTALNKIIEVQYCFNNNNGCRRDKTLLLPLKQSAYQKTEV